MKNITLFKTAIIAAVMPCMVACSAFSEDTKRVNVESASLLLTERPVLSMAEAEYMWNIRNEGAQPANLYAKDFLQNGRGDFRLSVTYERNKPGAAETAQKEVRAVERILDGYGIKDLTARIIPVSDAEAGNAVVAYTVITVKQPDDCAGLSIDNIDGHIEKGDAYRFGCATTAALTGMVAHKSDLAGNNAKAPVGSTQLGKTMSDYNSGLTQGQGLMNVTTGTAMTGN